MKKHYFFFDIDGTLTDRATGEIVPSAKEALAKLKKAGHFVAINTGRAYYKARPFFDANGFDNMVCNGGHGLVIDGKLVENAPLDFNIAKTLYDNALAAGYGVFVAEDDSIDVYARDFKFLQQAGERREPTRYIIEAHYAPKDTIYKLYISVPADEEDKIPGLTDLIGTATGVLRFEPPYVIIQPDEKHQGILNMLDRVGGKPEDVVVFGDDTNDLDMFTPPFYRVAMGNGHPALKKHADKIAPANTDDGIYRVCDALGFFEQVES